MVIVGTQKSELIKGRKINGTIYSSPLKSMVFLEMYSVSVLFTRDAKMREKDARGKTGEKEKNILGANKKRRISQCRI
jgi:hypothetical protein